MTLTLTLTGAFANPPISYGWIYPNLLMVLMIISTYCCVSTTTQLALHYRRLLKSIISCLLLYTSLRALQREFRVEPGNAHLLDKIADRIPAQNHFYL